MASIHPYCIRVLDVSYAQKPLSSTHEKLIESICFTRAINGIHNVLYSILSVNVFIYVMVAPFPSIPFFKFLKDTFQ